MKQPTRRQFVASAGTATLAATAGVFCGVQPTQAVSLDVHELQIDDQALSSTDAPDALPLEISGEYTIDANVAPDELRLQPAVVADASDIGAHEYPTQAQSLDGPTASGEFAFTVDLLALYALRDGFPSTAGESSEYTLTLTLGAAVTGPGGNKIGSAEVSDGFVLTLTHTQAQASIGLSVTATLVDPA